MVPTSPAEALGSHAHDVGPLLVETVRARHDRFADAHQASGSRYALGFGMQWRDLLDDVAEALRDRGYRTYKLPPAGYRLPVVNDCLVYVWRAQDTGGATSSFASSPTRLNGFTARLLEPTLFEPGFADNGGLEAVTDSSQAAELGRVVRATTDVMPLVLVLVQSSPRQLQSIDWAVAELDAETAEARLHGRDTIWEPELTADDAPSEVEPFDSGTPSGPTVEPQQQGARPDA